MVLKEPAWPEEGMLERGLLLGDPRAEGGRGGPGGRAPAATELDKGIPPW